MKVIYLDIDGVLNSTFTTERLEGVVGIDDELLSNLKSIVDYTGAKIVLISSWKNGWEKNDKHLQNAFGNYLD